MEPIRSFLFVLWESISFRIGIPKLFVFGNSQNDGHVVPLLRSSKSTDKNRRRNNNNNNDKRHSIVYILVFFVVKLGSVGEVTVADLLYLESDISRLARSRANSFLQISD